MISNLKNSFLFIALALFTVLPVVGQITIAESSAFASTESDSWPYAITLTTVGDGVSSRGTQTLSINVTDLPAGAQYRVVKSTANTYVEDHPGEGNFYQAPAQALSAGSNNITVSSVAFDRTVRIQFSSGAVSYDGLLVNATFPTVTIGVDDFVGLNTGDADNLAVAVSGNGFNLTLGPGTSSLGRDAFGVGSSTFGLLWALWDASYAKFGNSGNQQQLDLRITNNTGSDAKLKNISFDLRRDPANANYATDFQLLYLATGDSAIIKGASVAEGSEMNNLAGLGSDTISLGINNFSESIGQNISGTAWIADGGYANIRLKLNTTTTAAATQLDNLVVSLEVVDFPPVINIIGQTSLSLTQGDVFNDAGSAVTDDSGESITAVVSGDTVDTSVPGTYVIIYTATDSYGNSSSVTRTVTVEADSDGDGVADILDVHAGFDDAALSIYLSDNGYAQGGLTQQDLLDARVGSAAVSVSGGTATISLQVEQSADGMQTWSSPAEGATTVDIPVSGDASFFRVRAQ